MSLRFRSTEDSESLCVCGGGGMSVGCVCVCVCVEGGLCVGVGVWRGVVCVWVVWSVQSSIAHVMNVLLMYSK